MSLPYRGVSIAAQRVPGFLEISVLHFGKVNAAPRTLRRS